MIVPYERTSLIRNFKACTALVRDTDRLPDLMEMWIVDETGVLVAWKI